VRFQLLTNRDESRLSRPNEIELFPLGPVHLFVDQLHDEPVTSFFIIFYRNCRRPYQKFMQEWRDTDGMRTGGGVGPASFGSHEKSSQRHSAVGVHGMGFVGRHPERALGRYEPAHLPSMYFHDSLLRKDKLCANMTMFRNPVSIRKFIRHGRKRPRNMLVVVSVDAFFIQDSSPDRFGAKSVEVFYFRQVRLLN